MRDETLAENEYDPDDLPPEYMTYQDEGCEEAPACLECPLPHCIHDGLLLRQDQVKQRRLDMALKRLAGAGVAEIAAEYHVTRRTVSRAIADYQQGRITATGGAAGE
ncbi:MAG: helix-turn-helix domain-containing protein [Dehalogenimonas sp.]|uniref:Helix-turn-helix domain-containing protein n=1 Tax=Candidatus Dehalogenimonas loeffleri TaxID=3127115 RepID=A0ABZ2J1I0_9CHLR|nr:helix-turn-helix domain-containing protein [Dehalogenimonas sp.]